MKNERNAHAVLLRKDMNLSTILVILIVVLIGSIAYQQVQLHALSEQVHRAEAISLLPTFSAGCERLLEYESACAHPWGIVSAQDHTQSVTFYWKGMPASTIEVIVDGAVIDSWPIDVHPQDHDGSYGTIRGYALPVNTDLEPGEYDALIVARPGNQSITVPLIVLRSITDTLIR
jgi:hypothetical protein